MITRRKKRSSGEPFRRLGASFWTSPIWRETPAGPQQTVLMWLAMGPEQAMAPGVLPIGEGLIADALHMEPGEVRATLEAFVARGILHQDREHRLLWLPWRFDHEPPSNPDQVIGWRRELDAILPRCTLGDVIRRELRVRLERCDQAAQRKPGECFARAFDSHRQSPPSPHTVSPHGVPTPPGSRSGSPDADTGDGQRPSPAQPPECMKGEPSPGPRQQEVEEKHESVSAPNTDTVSPDRPSPPSPHTVGGHQRSSEAKKQESSSDQRRRSQPHQAAEKPPPLETLERGFAKDLAQQLCKRVSGSPKTWDAFLAEALEHPSRWREAAAREFLRRGCPEQGLGPSYLLSMIREGAGNPQPEPPPVDPRPVWEREGYASHEEYEAAAAARAEDLDEALRFPRTVEEQQRDADAAERQAS